MEIEHPRQIPVFLNKKTQHNESRQQYHSGGMITGFNQHKKWLMDRSWLTQYWIWIKVMEKYSKIFNIIFLMVFKYNNFLET